MAIRLKAKFQNVAITGTQLYVTRPVAYNTIGEKELANRIQTNTGISVSMIRAALDAIVLTIKEQVLNGHQVELGDLGYIRLGMKVKACDDPRDISSTNVKIRRLVFTPKAEFRQAMRSTPLSIEFDARNPKAPTDSPEGGE